MCLKSFDGDLQKVADHAGVDKTTAWRWARKFGFDTSKGVISLGGVRFDKPEPVEIVHLKRSLGRVQADRDSLKQQLKVLMKYADIVQAVKDMLQPVVYANTLPPPAKPKQKQGSGSSSTLVFHLADLHFGEIVDPAVINGVNEYNPVVAAGRVEYTVDVIRELVNDNPNGYDEIVIVVGGDTIGGSIHPESAVYYASAMRQALDVSVMLSQAVRELAGMFKKVRILGLVGNHPRTSNRMPTGKNRVETSYELIIYEFMATLLSKAKNVSFDVTKGYTLTANIYDERWAFSHGDATKGGGGQLGIPAYGLKRQHDAAREWSIVQAELTNQALGNTIVKHTRYYHFHTYFEWQAGSADIMLSPSPKGVDPFVKDVLGKYSPPMFVLEEVHPKHGKTKTIRVDLTNVSPKETRYKLVEGGEMIIDVWNGVGNV